MPATTTTRRLLGVGVVVVIAALLVTVWRFGGFREQQRPFQTVAPGTVLDAGPFELAFTEATAVHVLKTDYREASWKVTVIGTGRTTGDISIEPRVGFSNEMFLARNKTTGDILDASEQSIGPEGDDSASTFTPGLPPVRYTVSFEFADDFVVDETLRFAVVDQVYSNYSLIKTGDEDSDEKEWHNAHNGWQMDLPLRELPPDKD